jgi:enterochelin esterase-like enzyme
MNRFILLGACTLLFLVAATFADGQAANQKESQLPPMPKAFDAKRTGIERGKVETLEYDSTTVGSKRKLVVYTPPGYSKDNKYPVFYLLHGAGGNESNWTKAGAANTILDNLYADKKVVPMIVVMPNGTVQVGGAKDKGAKDKGAKGKIGDFVTGFEKELLNDVMPFAEGRYPIVADADHRALAGLSMGGGQSLNVGLRHLDKFAWIGGYSSALGKAGNLVKNGDDVNQKLKLLYVACGDADTLFNANKKFHTSLEDMKVKHVWNVVPEGAHNFPVWKNDLYLFAQMLFKENK